ncbi:MAG TPA: DUF3540 domain-containing protein [Gammaproteobacteria bacterium]
MQHANLIKLFGNEETRLETGIVIAREDGSYIVRTGQGVRSLARAFSCLVEPAENDHVLYAMEGATGSILAILERPGGGTAVLSHAAGMELRAAEGAVTLAARDQVKLASGEVTLAAGTLNATAAEAKLCIGDTELAGNRAKATLRDAALEAENIDTRANRLTQRVKRAFRFIEETEIVHAREILQRVKGLFTSRAKTAVITAAEDMKVDGKRIHLG